MPELFPLYLPAEARRLFQTESLLRRFAQAAHLSASSRLLEIHGSLGGLALARALNCSITIVEPDPEAATVLKDRAKSAGLSEQVSWLEQPLSTVSFPEKTFTAVFCFGRVIGHPEDVAQRFRPWLAEQGRLALTYLVTAGRRPAPSGVESWNKRLGRPLKSPRDTLLSIEAEGFEPEIVETLGDSELDEFYKELDRSLSTVPPQHAGTLTAEIAAHRAQGGRAGVTFAAIVGRRKEPGERPPVARDSG